MASTSASSSAPLRPAARCRSTRIMSNRCPSRRSASMLAARGRKSFAPSRTLCIVEGVEPSARPPSAVGTAHARGSITMSEAKEIRCWAYVTRPYADVRHALLREPARFLGGPTSKAVERAQQLRSTLKVDLAGLEIGKDVVIDVVELDFMRHPPHEPTAPAVTLELQWKAATNAALFPAMRARLMIYALSAGETQLDLLGWYTPPGGFIGSAADTI